MRKKSEIFKLFNEEFTPNGNCNLCKEAKFSVGQRTGYGIVINKVGNLRNGWFATLSPKTGGDPKSDFTVQIMPFPHLTHFSQIHSYPELSENFGVIFANVCRAMSVFLMQEEGLMTTAKDKIFSLPIAIYGKCTTWKEKKEHLHIKIFPFRGNIGQPYTVDSSFEKKEVLVDSDGKKYVKMSPVKKVVIEQKIFKNISKRLISLLKKND